MIPLKAAVMLCFGSLSHIQNRVPLSQLYAESEYWGYRLSHPQGQRQALM